MPRLDSGFAALSFDRVTFSVQFIFKRDIQAAVQVDEAGLRVSEQGEETSLNPIVL